MYKPDKPGWYWADFTDYSIGLTPFKFDDDMDAYYSDSDGDGYYSVDEIEGWCGFIKWLGPVIMPIDETKNDM